MTDKNVPTTKDLYSMIEYLGSELLKSQHQTRDAIISLAEAIAGVRQAKTNESAKLAETVETNVTVEPVQEEPINININNVREVFAEKSRAGHKDALKNLLDSYGVKKLPDLKADQLAEVMAKAQAL